MEKMSEFKVGDEVRIIRKTSGYAGKLRVGDSAKIDCFFFDNAGQKISARMTCDSNSISCYHNLENIKLAKPKWSIYNNDLPWEKLSNKQKGKILVADNDGIEIQGHGFLSLAMPVRFDITSIAYFAVKPEPAKPEPTMEELFDGDWKECFLGDPATFNKRMIVKGWTKPCK